MPAPSWKMWKKNKKIIKSHKRYRIWNICQVNKGEEQQPSCIYLEHLHLIWGTGRTNGKMTRDWSERLSCSGCISSQQNKPKTVKGLGGNTTEQLQRLGRRCLQVWRLASEASTRPFLLKGRWLTEPYWVCLKVTEIRDFLKDEPARTGLEMPLIQPPFKVVV